MTNPTTEDTLLPEDPAHASGPETVLIESAPLALEPETEPIRFTMSEAAAPSAPVASRGNAFLWLGGAGLVLLGAGLAAAPHLSGFAARKLAPLVAPELYGGVLISAGLVLLIGAVLRRSLTGIRSSLADLGAETSRLDQVSHDTQSLCMTLEQVQAANEESKASLANLQKRIERLTEIASDPDHTVSMFRLAASVDQLGARLDIFIKDQFKSMNQQLGGAVGQAQQIERNLLGRLTELGTQVGTQLGDQLAAQRQALTEGFERTSASTARASTGIEANLTAAARIEGQLAEHKKALAGAVEALGAERAKAVARLEAKLAEHKQTLASAVDSLGAGQVDAVERIEGTLAQHKQALGNTVESLAAEQGQTLARVEGKLAEHKQALSGAVDSLAAGQAKATERVEVRLAEHKKALGVAAESLAAEQVKAVVHIEGRFAEQQQALSSTVESLGADQLKATAALHESLNGLGERFEQHLQEQTTYVAECLGQLDGALERSGRERDALTRELAAGLEQQLAQHSSGLQQRLAPLAELEAHVAAQVQSLQSAISGGLNATARLEQQLAQHSSGLQQGLAPLAELESHVAAQLQNLQIAIAEGLERARSASSETHAAATEGLAATARLEQQLAQHSSGLQQDLAPLAEAAQRSVRAGAETEQRLHALLAQLETHVAAQVQNLQIAIAEGLERTRIASSETYEAATEGLAAAARLESRVSECQDNLSRAFASTRDSWAAGLTEIGGALEREGKAGHDRNSQSLTVTKRIEIEIAANSSRLERIADELRGLASLALQIRDARPDEPAARELLVVDPPPALPVQRDPQVDVLP